MSQATLSERIMDLREMKATVGERLQATETALTNARLEVLALQSRDQEKSRKIVALEVEAAQDRSQPTEAPQTMLRIQELDSKNKDLQHEISALTKEATELSDQLQQRTADVTGLVGRLADTETLLENSRRETTAIQKEKAASEERALVDRESMRKELSSAANMQLANVRNEHMNVVQQLKLKKSPADDKLKDVTRQLSVLQIEKERYEKDNGQLKASLDSMEQEKERDVRE